MSYTRNHGESYFPTESNFPKFLRVSVANNMPRLAPVHPFGNSPVFIADARRVVDLLSHPPALALMARPPPGDASKNREVRRSRVTANSIPKLPTFKNHHTDKLQTRASSPVISEILKENRLCLLTRKVAQVVLCQRMADEVGIAHTMKRSMGTNSQSAWNKKACPQKQRKRNFR
jgi:hypothetical protein